MKQRTTVRIAGLLLALQLLAACAPKQAVTPTPSEEPAPAPVIELVSEHDGGVIQLNGQLPRPTSKALEVGACNCPVV